jgi:hypothetical protein
VRWDGTSFAPLDVPPMGTQPSFVSWPWGSGPDDVWFAGDGVRRWTGAGFTTPLEMSSRLVFGLGPSDVWIVDGTLGAMKQTLVHWDGSTFASFTLRLDGVYIQAVWGGATNDVWAFGSVGGLGVTGSLALAHWDGTGWSLADNTTAMMTSRGAKVAWGSSRQNIWALVDNFAKSNSTGTVGVTEMWHYDGSAWTIFTELASIPVDTRAISGGAADDVWPTTAPAGTSTVPPGRRGSSPPTSPG